MSRVCSCTLAGANGCCQDQPPTWPSVTSPNTNLPTGTWKFTCWEPKPLTEDDIRRIIREELKRG